jgi:hypothetical protein
MRKRTRYQTHNITHDYSSWSFILFLTLAFILLVTLINAIEKTSNDLRTRAGLTCPRASLPDTKSCPGKWVYKTDARGCAVFFCED